VILLQKYCSDTLEKVMSLVTGTIMSIYLQRMPSIATFLACAGLSDILADAVNIFQVKFQFFVCHSISSHPTVKVS